ncbi:hypothetical protein [Phage f2b1]|nr:hypothetical protein [Phage f2b1]
MSNLSYVIMVIVACGYTLVLLLGLLVAYKKARKEATTVKSVIENAIEDLKELLLEEEDSMANEEKEITKVDVSEGIYGAVYFREDAEKQATLAAPSLTQLITANPTEEQYKEVTALLVGLAQRTYNKHKFYFAPTKDELEIPNMIQIRSHYKEEPLTHQEIFKKGVNYGLDMGKLLGYFAEEAAAGKVVDLGDNAYVITDDGTGNPPTGVSPINSGLEDGEITFLISFIKKDNYEEWHAKHFPPAEETEDE